MSTLYPYDEEGKNPSNLVTGSLSPKTFPNKFNVMVPKEAPFFRTDFKLTKNGVTLIEGLDYYLVYYYKKAADNLGRPLFGGVLPIGDIGDVNYQLRTLGGNHLAPQLEIGRRLNDPELKDPRSTDWEEMQRYPVAVDPIEPPQDFEEARVQDPIVSAIAAIKQIVADATPEQDEKYQQLFNDLADVENYYNATLLELHDKGEHDHKYTAADLNALRRNATAADALKAYGQTLAQLVNTAKENGISQTRVDELVNQNVGIMFGSLVGGNGEIKLTTYGANANNNPTVTQKAATIEVDLGNKDATLEGGEGGWLGAGLNAIVIPKVSGSGIRPVLNGYYILTPVDVPKYLTPSAVSVLRATVQSTPTVRLFGDGTPAAPIYGQVIPNTASETVEGLAEVVNEWGVALPAVVSQKLITDTINGLSNYALKSLRVNGKAFDVDGNVTITAAEINLGNVDNTEPGQKPVTTAITNALAGKVKDDHKHARGDLEGSIDATATVAGVGRLGEGGFALDEDVAEFITGTASDVEMLENALPAWASSGLYYGDRGYLPAPVYGSYVPVGWGGTGFHGEYEENRFVYLTVSGDYFGMGVYYGYIPINRAGRPVRNVPTTLEYRPAYLGGVAAVDVRPGDNRLMMVKDIQGGEWIVRTFGTMDWRKHTASRINPTQLHEYFPGNSFMHHTFTCDDVYVYIFESIDYRENLSFRCYRFPLEQIGVADVVTPEPYTVTGKDIYGNNLNGSLIKYAPSDRSNNLNDQPMVYDKDGSVISFTIATSRTHWHASHRDGKVVIFFTGTPLYSTGNTSIRKDPAQFQIEIDVNTDTFKIVNPDYYPLVLENGEYDGSRFGRVPGVGGYGYAAFFPTNGLIITMSSNDQNTTVRYATYTSHEKYHSLTLGANSDGVSAAIVGTLTLRPATRIVNFWRGFIKEKEDTYRYQDRVNSWTNVVVDVNTPYPGEEGFGPTGNITPSSVGWEVMAVPLNGRTDVFAGVVLRSMSDENRGDVVTVSNALSGSMKPIGSLEIDNKSILEWVRNSHTDKINAHYSGWVYGIYEYVLHIFGDVTSPDAVILQATHNVTVNGFNYSISWIYEVGGYVITSNRFSLGDLSKMRLIVEDNIGQWGLRAENVVCQSSYTVESDGGLRLYLGTAPTFFRPGSSTRSLWRLSKDSAGVWRTAKNAAHPSRLEHAVLYTKKYGWGRLIVSSGRDTVIHRPYVDSASGFVGSDLTNVRRIITSSRPPEGWVVYITQEYPFYADGNTYTMPIVDYDLRTLFPANYTNRTFYIYARVVNGKGEYFISPSQLDDTATRLRIGHVTTDDERIIDLNVNSTSRYGNVGALVRHEDNLYAHANTEPGKMLANTPYAEVKNFDTVDGFNLPTFRDVFNSWYRFSHAGWTNSQTGNHTVVGRYPASNQETDAWRYIDASDIVECTVNSGTYIGFISNDFVGDYVFNTVVTSHDGDNDAVTVILAAFKQGDIDNREHTLSLSIDQTVNESHHRPGSNIRLFDNYGQTDMRTVRTINPARFNRPWTNSYAHVYVRRTGNMLHIAVENAVIPSQYLNPRDELSLTRDKARLSEAEIMASPSYFKATVDLSAEAPKYARAARYGYGAFSQPRVRYWNIRRPGADLDSFYASEETYRVAMRRNPIGQRVINGKVAFYPQSPIGDGTIERHGAVDNYGDMFWPIGMRTDMWPHNNYDAGSGKPLVPADTYRRFGNRGTFDAWTLYKSRFTASSTGLYEFITNADDRHCCVVSGPNGYLQFYGWEIARKVFNININTAGDYAITIIAEEMNTDTPSCASFEVKRGGSVIASSTITETRAIMLPNGVSRSDASEVDVPFARMVPFERPVGTAISVSTYGYDGTGRTFINDKRYNAPPKDPRVDAPYCGVRIDTEPAGDKFRDRIYIQTPKDRDVEYQITVTKL